MNPSTIRLTLLLQVMLPLMLLLGAPRVALSQGDDLAITPVLGFDGFYRPGSWTPVFVDIANQPTAERALSELRDFEGQLLLVGSPIEGRSAMRFSRQIDIPAASQKRYVLYVRLASGLPQSPVLTLANQRGRILRGFNLHTSEIGPGDLLAIDITDQTTRPAIPRLRGGLDKMYMGRLSPQSLPDHWAGWEAADMVILSRWPDRGIAPEALEALRDWIQMGGTLVVLSGSEGNTYTDPAARALLPVEINGTAILRDVDGFLNVSTDLGTDDSGGRVFTVARSEPKPGSEVLLSRDGIPFIVRESLGLGQIIFLAVDFRSSSSGVEQFIGPVWHAVTPTRDHAKWEQNIPRLSGGFQAISGRAARPPNPLLIIAICILYTIVVGPLNFAWLAKRNKMEWAWFTLPAIVLVFFLLIYGMGLLMKERASSLRELRVEVYRGGVPLGSFQSFGKIFSAQARTLQLSPAGDRQVMEDVSRWVDYQEFQEKPFFTFGRSIFSAPTVRGNLPVLAHNTSGNKISSPSWSLGTYDTRTISTRGTSRLEGEISSHLAFGTRGLGGKITNHTPHDFEAAWLIHGGRHAQLGPMKPGESITIGQGEDAIRFLPGLPRIVGDDTPDFLADFDPLTANNLFQVIQGMFQPELTGILLPPNPGVASFVGVHHDTEDRDIESRTPFENHHRAIATIVHLDPVVERGERFRFVDKELRYELAGMVDALPNMAGEVSFQSNSSAIELRNRAAIVSVELPFFRPGTVVETITVTTNQAVHPSMEFAVEIFNHGAGRWEPVSSNVPIANNGFALNGNGRLYLRLVGRLAQGVTSLSWDAHVVVDNLTVILAGRYE